MKKDREWKINGLLAIEKGSAAYDIESDNETHVIEYSAYKKQAEALKIAMDALGMVDHVGMPEPYDKIVREALAKANEALGIDPSIEEG